MCHFCQGLCQLIPLMLPAWRSKAEIPIDSYAIQKLSRCHSPFPELLGSTPAGCFQVRGKEEVTCSG